jgi:hypothetical protein
MANHCTKQRWLPMHPYKISKVKAGNGFEPIDPRAFGLTKAAYSVNETLGVLSVGRTSLYKLVKGGDLRPAKLGKKTLFTAPDIVALLAKLRERVKPCPKN